MTLMLHRSHAISREQIRQSSRAKGLATALVGLQNNAASYVNTNTSHRQMPFNFHNRQIPTKVPGLPRSNFDDDDSDIMSIRRGVGGGRRGYATHFDRPPSDDNYSTQIDRGYARQLSRHDDDEDFSSISRLQLLPGNFGGIAQRRRKEFGRGPSTLLTGDAYLTINATDNVKNGNGQSRAVGSSSNLYARRLSLLSDNEDGQSRGVDINNDGYTRQLSRHSDDNDKASDDLQMRPGRFGKLSGRYQNFYGRGPRTFLTGRRGFLTSSIDTDDIETNQRGRGVGSGDAAASQRSGSVLAALRNWRNRSRIPRNEMEMQVPEWLREEEPKQSRQESFVDIDDSDENNNVSERYASQLPPSSFGDE